ncbi:MAG: hypothetical protein N3F67_02855 [Acidilobaceae archaeon]|nr:hypothetical protein [Acidilobaceae archaeon]
MQSSELRQQYSKALQAARAFKLELREGDVIVYSRGAEPPAQIAYIAALHAGMSVYLASTAEASLHMLPYAERPRAVVFSASPKDNRAVSAAITASLLCSEALLVAPPQPPALEERLEARGVGRLKLPHEAPLMTSSALALLSAPKLMGLREGRVRGEIEALESAYEWALGLLQGLRRRSYDLIAYSPSTKSGAYYYSHALSGPEPVPIEALPSLKEGASALALYASAEEWEYREVMLSPRRAEAEFLAINSDPVTASFYSVLLASLLAGKLI